MKGTRFGIAAVCVAATLAGTIARPTAQQATGRVNRIIAQYEQGKPAIVEEHWDWIEMEQNPWTIVGLQARLAALKKGPGAPVLTPVLRIPPDGSEPFRWFIKQTLNMGLATIVVPQIEKKEEALRVVTSMRYPPQRGGKYPEPRGMRSYGPGRAAAYWGVNQADYMRKADVWPLNPDGELLAIMMIETRAGVDNIKEIVSVPGVGGILIGPSDLGMSLGVGPPAGGKLPPETEAAIQKVRSACMAVKKIICGISAVAPGDWDRRLKEGWHLLHRGGARPTPLGFAPALGERRSPA